MVHRRNTSNLWTIDVGQVQLSLLVVVKDDHVVGAGAVVPVGEQGGKGSHGHLQRVPLHACHETCLSNGSLRINSLVTKALLSAPRSEAVWVDVLQQAEKVSRGRVCQLSGSTVIVTSRYWMHYV